MSRQSTDTAVSSQRLLASAIGVAITAIAAPQAAHADEAGQKKTDKDRVLSLDAATIVGEQQDETTYNVDRSASKKYTAPLLDTPKTVTVIPQQVIKDTGALTLADALRTTPGITFGAGEGGNPAGDRPFIRGFNAESDTFLDGMRDVASQTREVFNVEQIEVSKGPGSAYTGAGSTGGSLNLISKTAKQDNFTDAGFTWGSDQTRRTTRREPDDWRQRRLPPQPDEARCPRRRARRSQRQPLGRGSDRYLRLRHADPRHPVLLPSQHR